MIHQISPDAPDSISTKLDVTPRRKAHNSRALWKLIFGQDSDDSDDDESPNHPIDEFHYFPNMASKEKFPNKAISKTPRRDRDIWTTSTPRDTCVEL